MTQANDYAELALKFAAYVQKLSFPCAGARSAFNRNRVRFGLYEGLGDGYDVIQLCEDLNAFSLEFPDPESDPVTFIAMFKQSFDTPQEFDHRLWQHLQAMHDSDIKNYVWDSSVSANPASSEFSFSIAGRAFFIVGLSPVSQRIARRAPMPCLVFNFHNQFESMRISGEYNKLQKGIRKLDQALQGSINPMLSKFGQDSEARQYSGLNFTEEWKCPFQQRKMPNEK